MQQRSASAAARRIRAWPIVAGVLTAALAAVLLLWDWDWFRPLVEAQASAALGRRVTMQHFGLRLSWHPTATASNVTVAAPAGFPEAPYFARIDQLAVTADANAYLHGRRIVIERIDVRHPDINALQHADGNATWDFPALTGGSKPSNAPTRPSPQIGDLVIADGTARVVVPKLRADFQLKIHTDEPSPGSEGRIVVAADGTYARQRITGGATGGALLTLRDAGQPYPIDAHVENGPTRVALNGTVQDPLHFAGTDLRLHLSGPDMALLYPLTGIPIPQTPPYDIAGHLDYADRKVRFTDFRGRLGSSDIGGTIAVDPTTPQRPTVDATLASERIDLADLGGFIGSPPGRTTTPGQTPQQRREVNAANHSVRLLPTQRLNVPKLTAADIHLDYRGAHVEGRSVPFDTFAVKLDITDGRVTLHPIQLGVGTGRIAGTFDLRPRPDHQFATDANIAFDRVDLGRLLAATHLVHGGGLIGGHAAIETTGDSIATLLGNGDGGLTLLMSGGDLSALLVDLSGLELGNAILSALGVPQRARLQCFAADLALRRGVLETRALLLDTSEADVVGSGTIDLRDERLDYTLRTASRHFSVGSLPTPIRLTGTFKNPSVGPAVGPLAARAGAAIGLGILLTPLAALLPTVQFGTGKTDLNRCEALVHEAPASDRREAQPARR
jgi:uncharacterized protein involved in outer membrane biogenesis